MDRSVVRTADPDVLLVLTSRHGDCGMRDRYRIERVVASTGARTVLLEGRDGYPIIEEGPDGSLYIQVGDTMRRFPDQGAGAAANMPAGLGLTAAPFDFNPYC